MITRLIFAGILIGLAVVPGSLLSAEESSRQSSPVTRQEVWEAVRADLRQRGAAERQLPRVEDIDLPAALPALAGRKLRVVSACWDEGRGRTQFRLECGAPGQCLPFLVYVQSDVHKDVQNGFHNDVPVFADADAGRRVRSCQSVSGPHSETVSRLSAVAASKPTVKTGDRATAVFLSSHMRMTASVTCMERGHAGEVIRVRAPDGHVFRARISGPTLVEALPQ